MLRLLYALSVPLLVWCIGGEVDDDVLKGKLEGSLMGNEAKMSACAANLTMPINTEFALNETESSKPSQSSRPNILLVISDQQVKFVCSCSINESGASFSLCCFLFTVFSFLLHHLL
jgi:hypothetical protein